MRATLAKARAISDWIDCEPCRRPADAARREHVTQARICQLLRLMRLAPDIWKDIEQTGRTGPVLEGKELRMLAGAGTREQVRRYRALLGLDQKEEAGGESLPDVRKAARHRGLVQQLAHARELHALVESGRFSSVRALARHAGLSGTRASQLLGLLDLAPGILAAIEAAGGQELRRRIARMEERGQLREWRRLLHRKRCEEERHPAPYPSVLVHARPAAVGATVTRVGTSSCPRRDRFADRDKEREGYPAALPTTGSRPMSPCSWGPLHCSLGQLHLQQSRGRQGPA